MNPSRFYHTLSEIEKVYWDKLDALFQLVKPQKPERGIQTIIERARTASGNLHCSAPEHLEKLYLEAKERTMRRLALLNQCQLSK